MISKTTSVAVLAAALALSGCATPPQASIPTRPDTTMQQARTDIRACSTEANQSADTAMVGTYIGMALAGGLVGLAATASDDSDLRARAEANGMDACLSRSGYSRRILTQAELDALDARTGPNRTALLDYLVAGGDLATYPGV